MKVLIHYQTSFGWINNFIPHFRLDVHVKNSKMSKRGPRYHHLDAWAKIANIVQTIFWKAFLEWKGYTLIFQKIFLTLLLATSQCCLGVTAPNQQHTIIWTTDPIYLAICFIIFVYQNHRKHIWKVIWLKLHQGDIVNVIFIYLYSLYNAIYLCTC